MKMLENLFLYRNPGIKQDRRILYLMMIVAVFIACSEESNRVDISYTGDGLRGVYAPLGGIGTGSIRIKGPGAIDAFDIFSYPAERVERSSQAVFMLYTAVEGEEPVVRILERVPLDESMDSETNTWSSQVDNESSRVDNESSRVDNESSRDENESSRGYNESSRGYNAGLRDDADSSLDNYESSLGYKESSRSYNESSRGYKESSRSYNESSRGYNESSRGYNESSLDDNESYLDDNESSRSYKAGFQDEIRSCGADAEGLQADTKKRLQGLSTLYGFPRFREVVFRNAYPVVHIDLLDDAVPLEVSMKAWGPSVPLDIINSMLPAAVIEWTFTNTGKRPVNYSVALAMKNPLETWGRAAGKDNAFGRANVVDRANAVGKDNVVDRANAVEKANAIGNATGNLFITPYLFNDWKGFTFSNTGSKALDSDVGAVRVLSSSGGGLVVPYSGWQNEWPDQFWNDFSADGSLESGIDSIKSFEDGLGVAAMYTSGLLGPDESVTIPFLFLWYIPGARNPDSYVAERTAADDVLISKNLYSGSYSGIDGLTHHLIDNFGYIRDRTMQFSHSLVTSTIDAESLEPVLRDFSGAVEQGEISFRGKVFSEDVLREFQKAVVQGELSALNYSDPFNTTGTQQIAGSVGSAWNRYQAVSGYAYERESGRMTFSPETDVLPVRFFWATDSGWGTIDVSRARIIVKCIHGSADLRQLILKGRSFFVFREFVPSLDAEIIYENEALKVLFAEALMLNEGASFTMEIP